MKYICLIFNLISKRRKGIISRNIYWLNKLQYELCKCERRFPVKRISPFLISWKREVLEIILSLQRQIHMVIMARKEITYTPSAEVCSKEIHIVLEDDVIVEVGFKKGCAGNTQGVAALLKGMKKDEAIRRLRGICCGRKSTSCPDQLAQALENMA